MIIHFGNITASSGSLVTTSFYAKYTQKPVLQASTDVFDGGRVLYNRLGGNVNTDSFQIYSNTTSFRFIAIGY